jgi:hypothetical protein
MYLARTTLLLFQILSSARYTISTLTWFWCRSEQLLVKNTTNREIYLHISRTVYGEDSCGIAVNTQTPRNIFLNCPDWKWVPPSIVSRIMGNEGYSTVGKVAEAWVWQLTSIWCLSKQYLEISVHLPYASKTQQLIKHQDNFTLLLLLRITIHRRTGVGVTVIRSEG